MTSQLRIPCVCTKPSAVCIYTCSDSVLVICCVSTDRGESRLTEAEARNPIQGTRGNVFYLPIPPDMAKEPGQEGTVTSSGGITNHSDVLACPRNSHIEATLSPRNNTAPSGFDRTIDMITASASLP